MAILMGVPITRTLVVMAMDNPNVKVQVHRQACCAADDQLGPLTADYSIAPDAPLSELIEQIRASCFLQFSSTHTCITGEANGRLLVEVFSAEGPPPAFHVSPSLPVGSAIGGHTLHFRFLKG